jgi:hypothetical protein
MCRRHGGLAAAASLVALAGCEQKKEPAIAPEVGSAVASASAEAPAPSTAPSARCTAGSSRAATLATLPGTVYALAADEASLYYGSWDLYSRSGKLGRVPKNGEGASTLVSLDLEPRGLALDGTSAYYTAGIRMMKVGKDGSGEPQVLAPVFSSQDVALDSSDVFGVPGDYGPYDRLAKLSKDGGTVIELFDQQRPKGGEGPKGLSRVAVDASGVYVTDSGGDRVLRFPPGGGKPEGKPETIARGQARAFDLALDATNVYFTRALSGELMAVPKTGGAATQLASGLVPNARIATGGSHVFASFGKPDAPSSLSKVATSGGKPIALASIPANRSVGRLAVDDRCVYWVERDSASGNSTLQALGL